MTNLPITHLTLYKHGVGFFERRANVTGEAVDLSFRVDDMNDVLKSLTAIDWGDGQVLGMEYATPQSQDELLAGCSIRLADDRSLRDLLVGLRGRRVRLALDQGEDLAGILIGLDEVPERQPVATSLVSILLDAPAGSHSGPHQSPTNQPPTSQSTPSQPVPNQPVANQPTRTQTVALSRVQGVDIRDERGAGDLRFFLQTSLSQENYRQVTIRLSPGDHDLSVSYIAPAPTWRVSYRLVADAGQSHSGKALLLGLGIFDNRLEEDLQAISLALVAGMPISFTYDLYTPFTPERPVVEEEARVAAAPIGFAGATLSSAEAEPDMFTAMSAPMPPAPAMLRARAIPDRDMLAAAAPVNTSGESLGELFQYTVGTPVTVGRGQSAMVPIVSSDLEYRKDLIYNGDKLPAHPVATFRCTNASGLTLERGPATVIEHGEYVGEAVLPFTVAGAELVLPYAVELGAKVREDAGASRNIRGLSIQRYYLLIEEWDARWREYRLTNTTGKSLTILVEHQRNVLYDLFDTSKPKERTDEHYRFEVDVPAHGESVLKVQERRLLRRQEELRRQSLADLQSFAKQGLLNKQTQDRAADVLRLWAKIAEDEQRLATMDADRKKVYQAQQQIQGNMGALSATGKEGALRAQYVDQLQASEEQLKTLGQEEISLKAGIERLKQEVEARLRELT